MAKIKQIPLEVQASVIHFLTFSASVCFPPVFFSKTFIFGLILKQETVSQQAFACKNVY